MEMTFDQLYDYDWFAISTDGYIAHFATGGTGAIPDKLHRNPDLIQQIKVSLIASLSPSSDYIINPNLESYRPKELLGGIDVYLSSYIQMASLGLFSFDTLQDDDMPSSYYLVAEPRTPIHIQQLPHSVQEMLAEFHLASLNLADKELGIVFPAIRESRL